MANILVVGPHPDDQEIGMGGTIALLAAQGHNLLILDLTDGCPTPVGDRPTRLREAAAAATALAPPGSAPIPRVLLDLPNRRLEHTIEARHKVAGVIRAHQSTVIFVPHPEDAHPDHLAATRIVEDARFDAKLTKVEMPLPPGFDRVGPPIHPKRVFYYYCSHLKSVPAPSFIVDTTGHAEQKLAAIECYATQFSMNPINASYPQTVRAIDVFFGSRIGAGAGEPFWVREPLGLESLTSISGVANP